MRPSQAVCDECGGPRSPTIGYGAKDGRALCRNCRGVGRRRLEDPPPLESICPQCGRGFKSRKRGGEGSGHTVTCSLSCSNLRRNGVPPGGAHRAPRNLRRRELEASSPGLGRRERQRLLREWATAGVPCEYCGGLVATVDHRLPLHLGGTNFLDNLAPACRPCNTSKGRLTLTEWGGRRGHPLHGVRHSVPGEAGDREVLRGALQEAGTAGPDSSRYRDSGDAHAARVRLTAARRVGSDRGVDGARAYERGPAGHGPWCCGFGVGSEAG